MTQIYRVTGVGLSSGLAGFVPGRYVRTSGTVNPSRSFRTVNLTLVLAESVIESLKMTGKRTILSYGGRVM